MTPRARFLFYVLPVLVWMTVIFVASTAAGLQENTLRLIVRIIKLLSPDQAGGLPADTLSHINLIARKVAHLSEYAILALLTFRASQIGANRLKPKSAILGLLIPALYACTDEFHQSFVPGRTAAVQDVIIDSVGALTAITAVLLFFALKACERRLNPSLTESESELPNATPTPEYLNT